MKRLFAILLIAIAAFTSHAWTWALLDSPTIKAFVLSDRFWPVVIGALIAFSAFVAAALSAMLFHTARLSGRTGRELGE